MKMDEITDLAEIETPPEPPMNDLALMAFLAGVGGWVLGVIGICPIAAAFTGGFSVPGCTSISFIAWITAIPLGYLARKQLKEWGEGGDHLARWGIISGAVGLSLSLLLFCAVFAAVMAGTVALPFLD